MGSELLSMSELKKQNLRINLIMLVFNPGTVFRLFDISGESFLEIFSVKICFFFHDKILIRVFNFLESDPLYS